MAKLMGLRRREQFVRGWYTTSVKAWLFSLRHGTIALLLARLLDQGQVDPLASQVSRRLPFKPV